MATTGGPNIERDGLVFGYDIGYGVADNNTATRFYPGGSTENLISQMVGTTDFSYPETVYRCTATETNISNPTAPGGKYSRFTGNDSSSNNQLYSRFNTAGIDVRNSTITYSVYLKGSGTCHLTIYADNAGYGTSSTITLTDKWTRYTYSRAVTNYTSNCWVAVRGVLDSTDVYIAAQQAEIKSFSTPFTTGTRSSTQSLIDLTKSTTIDVSNVSFDSTGQPTFDGTDDIIDTSLFSGRNPSTNPFTVEAILKSNTTSGNKIWVDATSNGSNQRFYSALDDGGGTPIGIQGVGWSDPTPSTTNYIHQTIVMDGSTARSYRNGSASYTRSYTSYTLPGSLKIGGRSGYNWNGEIPVFKLYDRALSADEVQQNYNAYKNRFNL